jgi:hypothetical protein
LLINEKYAEVFSQYPAVFQLVHWAGLPQESAVAQVAQLAEQFSVIHASYFLSTQNFSEAHFAHWDESEYKFLQPEVLGVKLQQVVWQFVCIQAFAKHQFPAA